MGAALTAIMTGVSYATSAEMAERAGAVPRLQAQNADHMLRVMRNHRTAAYGATDGYEASGRQTGAAGSGNVPDDTLGASGDAGLGRGAGLGEKHGYRNAQVSVIAPTGTIGLVMDCDTTGIEPDFALVKFKKLAGGGYFKIINRSVPAALENLGYKSSAQIEEIIAYAVGHGTLGNAPGINHTSSGGPWLWRQQLD